MHQSLPNIIKIYTVPCDSLPTNVMEKHLAQISIAVVQGKTPVEHYDNASCEAEQEHDNNGLLEKTVLQFTTTDEIAAYPPLAFVVTDAQQQSWVIGAKEAPFPIVEVTKSIDRDTNVYAVKVSFSRRKSLIPCSV